MDRQCASSVACLSVDRMCRGESPSVCMLHSACQPVLNCGRGIFRCATTKSGIGFRNSANCNPLPMERDMDAAFVCVVRWHNATRSREHGGDWRLRAGARGSSFSEN